MDSVQIFKPATVSDFHDQHIHYNLFIRELIHLFYLNSCTTSVVALTKKIYCSLRDLQLSKDSNTSKHSLKSRR